MVGDIYLDKDRGELYEIFNIVGDGNYADVVVKYVDFREQDGFRYFFEKKRLNTFYKKVRYNQNYHFENISKKELDDFFKTLSYYDGKYYEDREYKIIRYGYYS